MTTYHIRTYNCVFPLKDETCISDNNLLIVNPRYFKGYLQIASNNFLRMGEAWGIYCIPFSGIGESPALKDAVLDYQYTKLFGSSKIKGCIFETIGGDPGNIEKQHWIDRGWSINDLPTFKIELCTFFNNNKGNSAGGYEYDWGTDAGHINMLLFICTFEDLLGKEYYTSLFYMGNDSMADETIIV